MEFFMNNLKNPLLFQQKNYINGEWVEADNQSSLNVVNPFDNSSIGHVSNMGKSETEKAIHAADKAFKKWSLLTAHERGAFLHRFAELIEKNKHDLARIITLENGKPLRESLNEINYANSFNSWFAEEAKRTYGDIIPTTHSNKRLLVIKQAVGVCVAITPWNFPMAMIVRKAAPALAAGCTIVIKPAESTPYSALALAVLAQEAGIPEGVFNVITGNPAEIGEVFSTHPLVKKLSFTGSTRIGKLLMQQSSSTVKKLSLELGGNAPFIVFKDANIQEAIEGLMIAKFRNSGQACVAANRLYVQEEIMDAFLKALTQRVKQLNVGNGLDEKSDIGPLINAQAVEKIEKLIQEAVSHGAKILAGGHRHSCSINAFEPTIITQIPKDTQITCTEIFGPIIAVYSFKDEEEAIMLANQTPYGLAAYLYSRDIGRIWNTAEQLEFGMVSINQGLFSNEVAPFGGIKESGFGREGSKYGIEDYLNIKYLCMGIC